jgi:hypothetical protein
VSQSSPGDIYQSYDQRRYVSGSSDYGSGASVGLSPALTASTSYGVALRAASDSSGHTLNYNEAVVVGIVLGYTTGQPPVPEWSTVALVSIGAAAVAGFVWLRRRKPAAVKIDGE